LVRRNLRCGARFAKALLTVCTNADMDALGLEPLSIAGALEVKSVCGTWLPPSSVVASVVLALWSRAWFCVTFLLGSAAGTGCVAVTTAGV
jgi:hypothetical protein